MDNERIKYYVKTIQTQVENGKLYCIVELVNDFPNEQELCREIIEYVNGQCSDGWGESFEQQEFSAKDYGFGYGSLTFHTWKKDKSCLSIWEDKLKQLNDLAKELFPQEMD